MFRSTERHLSILKIGGAKALDFSKKVKRKQQFSNHVASRYVRGSGSRPLKLKEVAQPRLMSTSINFGNIPLINPDKPNPDEIKELIQPMQPITLPRFPKNIGPASFPSVTKILQETMPASSKFLLDKWKDGMIKKLGPAGFAKYQQETFERGRLLHAVLADYMLGHGVKEEEVSKDIVSNLWKSIEGVVKEKISNVRLVEHIVTHPSLKYRGIVDCVACYEKELVVIDFKTAEKPKKTVGSLYDNPLQVTAYCGAINNDKSIPRSVIDRNICSGLVIVAYIDGSEASVYYLGRDKVANDYWKQWTTRLEQYSRMEAMKQDKTKNEISSK